MSITEEQLTQCEVDLADLGSSLADIRKRVDDDHERLQWYIRRMSSELLHLGALLKQLTEEVHDV